MMRPPVRTVPLLLTLAVLVGSCGRTDSPTGLERNLRIDIPINPALVPSPADAGAAPINRIRAEVRRVTDDEVIGEAVVDVDPTADEWVLSVGARVGDGVQGMLHIYLLNVSGDVETVQFSGIVGPLDLEPGLSLDAPDVPIVRGPIANLFVTGLTITVAPDTLMEGRTGILRADAPTSDGSSPTVFWTALDSAILSTSDSMVSALLPGTGRVAASAGSFVDTASIVVLPSPVDVLIAPQADTLVGPGAQAVFTAAVVDARGDTLTGDTVLWRSGTPGVATSLGGGAFQGVAPGSAVIRALAASDTTVEGTATLLVEAPPADGTDVAVSLTASSTSPVEGDTITLTVRVDNLDGPDAVEVTNLEVAHAQPGALSFLSAAISTGTYDGLAGVWSVPTLAVGAFATADLDFEVATGAGGTAALDSAWIAAVDQAQSDLSNDTATIALEFVTRRVDVEVEKTVDVAQPLEGETVTFTVSVINHGPGPVADLVVFDTLAGVFTAPVHTLSAGTLTDSLWSIPTLPEGDTATWTTTATVAPDVGGGSASNTAVLRSVAASDSTPANDSATVAINFPLSAVPVVTITAPADGSVYDPGELATFSATATDPEEGDLTAAIQWRSDLDGALGIGGSFETDVLSTGVHRISASATDTDGGTGADTITVTVALITTPATLNVPFGGTASLPITLSEAAPAGGFTVTVSAADPSITTPTSSSVFIAGGTTSANATLQGLAPGTTDVTVTNPTFGTAVTTVSVTADLNITTAALTVPETFPQEITIRLESLGAPIAAPAGGLVVTLTPTDAACASAPANVTIPAGLVQRTATISAAAGASTPCGSWVRAEAPTLAPDSVNVSVTATPGITVPNATVGSGLQLGFLQANLGTTLHDGVTARVESSDPTLFLVSPDQSTVGTTFIDVPVPAGQFRVLFYAHGLEGQTGSGRVRVSAPGFVTDSADVTVAAPGLRLISLQTTNVTTLDPDDPFLVQVGVPNGTNTTLQSVQPVRAGADSLDVTVTSSAPAVGEVVTLTDASSPVTVRMGPGQSSTGGSLALGGVAFVPQTVGATTVSASIPGFTTMADGSATVSIAAPGITVNASTVGAGLQWGGLIATLGATGHGGVDVLLESSDPSVLLLSPDASTAGTATITVSVPDGSNRVNYYVQGVEGADGVATLTVSAPGFTAATADVTVLPAGYEIVGLNASTTSLSPDDIFQVRVGVPFGANVSVSPVQAVRVGGTALDFTVSSSNTAVGDLITLADSASPVPVQIPVGASSSSSILTGGAVFFEPIGAGTTTVTATHPTLVRTDGATQTVTVTAPGITVNPYTVAAGLQFGLLTANLQASDHGGVDVTIESADPSVMLVSAAVTDPGTTSVDVPVGTGITAVRYVLHGVDGQAGTAYLRMSAPGFATDSALVTIVPPGVDLVGVPASLTTLSPDDLVQARVGVPNAANSALQTIQQRRAGEPDLVATVTSSAIGVATMVTNSTSGASVTAPIAPGQSTTPSTLGSGGIYVDPLGNGTSTLTASIPGFTSMSTTASRDLDVTTPGITVPTLTVGAGLQLGLNQAILGVTTHGGRDVTLTSSNPAVFRVSPDATTGGTASIVVNVPDGENRVFFYVHGMEDQEGTATLLVTASGFTDGSSTVTVVPPALDISSLVGSYTAGGADDAFWVRLGVPNATGTSLASVQPVRIGGVTRTVTITSSNPTAAALLTPTESGASVTLTLAPGESNTPTSLALGGVVIDPLAAGTTTISATIPGVVQTTNGSRPVTINP